jgi:hypothetical protein
VMRTIAKIPVLVIFILSYTYEIPRSKPCADPK